MVKYVIILERSTKNYSDYSPDLPGCVATGRTRKSAEKNMRKALELHVRGLQQDHQPLPEPRSYAGDIQVC